ncbi:MAG: 4Fe-4S dicluster domain-containing protein [Planctomycetota bacterium]|jgi:molybdopterin-containing oxidoreductase family iron-sulfur binding subunit
MVIDLDRCTACQACSVACRQENNVPFGGPDEAKAGRSIFWMQMLSVISGEYPELDATFIPRPCMHCAHPACIKVCPVGATYQNEEGIVAQIYERCIGCRYCTVACPYTVRSFNWHAPHTPEPLDNIRNRDVSVRPKGVVEKCTFCIQRIRAAKEEARAEDRELRDGDVVTACQEAGPASAITFGDLNDPESEVRRLSRSKRAFQLLEDLGTHPKVYYLKEGEWDD